MTWPVLRGAGPMASATGVTLTVTLPAQSEGDLLVLYNRGIVWTGDNDGRPNVPPGWHELYGTSGTSGFEQILWRKVGPGESAGTVRLTASSGQRSATWWGHADVFANADFRDPGWLQTVAGTGNYALFTRADLPVLARYGFAARVAFNQFGIATHIMGWANGDANFRLNAANKLNVYVRNTSGANIGEGPATIEIPDIGVGKKVWLKGEVEIATAECTYWYSYVDVEEIDAVDNHWLALGTPVVGTNAGTTPRVSASDSLFIGTRDTATAAVLLKVFAAEEHGSSGRTFFQNFTEPLQAGLTIVGSDTHRVPTPELGSSSPIEDFGSSPSAFPTSIFVPNRQVFGPDRLIYNVWTGGSNAGHQSNPVEGPSNGTRYDDRAATFGTKWAAKNVTRTLRASSDTVDFPAAQSGHYTFGYIGLTIRGLESPVLPPLSPQAPVMRLGCATSYDVFITDMTYDRIIERVGWSSLNWERVLDDISTAGATLPDELGGALCVAHLGGLLPWAYGLRIERNSTKVWSGPIRQVSRQGNALVVSASDVWARYRKRFAIRTGSHDHNDDAGELFAHIFEHAATSYDQWTPAVPKVKVGSTVSRSLRPMEFKYAWDLLSELLGSAVDAFVMNGTVYVFEPGAGWRYQAVIKRTLDGPYNANYDLVYGTFPEQAWATRPDWTIDGDFQANYVAAPAADSGEFGYRIAAITEVVESQARFGVLDYVDPSPIELPADQPPATTNHLLKARSDSIAALRAYAPATVEGGTLSEYAPIDVDNLIPGSIWKVDINDAGFGQLTTVSRLRRVAVSVTANGTSVDETVSPTLEPPGQIGGSGV